MLLAAGTIRLSLHSPDYGIRDIHDMTDLNYCSGATLEPGQLRLDAENTTQFPCQFRDEFFVTYPIVC